MKIDQYKQAKSLMSQALSVAVNSLGEGRAVQEAKLHMRRAISKLEEAGNKHERRNQTERTYHQQWWDNIVTGSVAASQNPMSPEATQKSLDQLNSMIDTEKKKLEDLESDIIDNQTTNSNSVFLD